MSKTKVTAIILGCFLFLSLGGLIVTENKNQELESDLCYTLKTNRLLFEGYTELLEENYIIEDELKDSLDDFDRDLSLLEKRNWMGCEE